MSYSGDAAEQVVRMSLEGGEVAVKLAGKGAKELALLLYAILKDQKKTKGKIRLTNMLRSGKELKVFAVKDTDLLRFCKEAKKYGVLYCVLKDRDATDGITDIMVRAEDASKINRIFERFQLSTVDMASIKSDIERSRSDRTDADAPGQEQAQDAAPEQDTEAFLKALFQDDHAQEEPEKNPTSGRTSLSPRSEPTSEAKTSHERSVTNEERVLTRPSVRQELAQIKAALEQKSADDKQRKKAPAIHKEPPKKKVKTKAQKGKER
jgi:hypothetical protein